MPCRVTFTFVMVPTSPETFIEEGYGVAALEAEITMFEELANKSVPLPGGLTVSRKEVLVLLKPLLALTVIGLVPVWPSRGVMTALALCRLRSQQPGLHSAQGWYST